MMLAVQKQPHRSSATGKATFKRSTNVTGGDQEPELELSQVAVGDGRPTITTTGGNHSMTMLEESMESLMNGSNDNIHNKKDSFVQADDENRHPNLTMLNESSGSRMSINSHSHSNDTEEEVLEDSMAELPEILEEGGDDEPSDASASATRRSSQAGKAKRSSLISGKRRPSRHKSADGATLRQRMFGSSSSIHHNNDGDDNDQEEEEEMEEDTSQHRPLSRSYTGDNSRLANMKMAAPTKRRPSRKKSTGQDLKGNLRRSRTSDGRATGVTRQASNSNALSRMSRMLRRPPSRNASNPPDVLNNSSQATDESSPSSLRRSQTSDGSTRSTPKRNFSSNFTRRSLPHRAKSTTGSIGTTTSGGHKRPSRTSSLRPKPTTLLNIFGSDLVSTDFILGQLDELEHNTTLVQVELEDCWVTPRATAIPLRLKAILQSEDIRPWEGIHFVDELLDATVQYKMFKRNRKAFLRALGGVCAQRVIPVTYTVKVHLKDNEDEEEQGDDPDITSLVSLLEQFQKDGSVTTLHLTTEQASLELVQRLTQLLQCDGREWDPEMRLQVSPLSMELQSKSQEVQAIGGAEQWQEAMKMAMEQLKLVVEAKGLKLIQ